jgi:excinuclease UvrABC nuclease subunit
MVGSRHFDFHNILEEDNELIASFLLQHYEKQLDAPKEILIPFELSEKQSIEEILSIYQSHKISLTFPQRGEKKILMEMARVNAEGLFKSQKSEESLREKMLLLELNLFLLWSRLAMELKTKKNTVCINFENQMEKLTIMRLWKKCYYVVIKEQKKKMIFLTS